MRLTLPAIHHDKAGIEALGRLSQATEHCLFDDIEIDMNRTTWFDADMCAAFGAILFRLGENLNTVTLTNIESNVESILAKNGFLTHYGRSPVVDHWNTTVSYHKFSVMDERYFSDYIERELVQRTEIPSMSTGLLKKFRESIFEIFSNSVLHSRTKLGIFSCGQFFPSNDRIHFTVADLGIGIRRKISEHLNCELSSEEAIVWATEATNTTKRGSVPGGLGLKLLREFIDLNDGSIQIASDLGYWQRRGRTTVTEPLRYSFPGTVVSVEINTADTHSYSLSSEMLEGDLF